MHAISTNELQQFIEKRNEQSVKLHLGCGGVRLDGFINVDLHPADPDVVDSSRDGCLADVFADMRELGLSDNSVDEMQTYHTIDHFTRWECIDMVNDWFRMLRPGGKLVIEVADFARCVMWLFHPLARRRQVAKNQFYGNQWDRIDFETHRYVWSARELKKQLKEIGFSHVAITHRTQTHYPGRDMRVTATK